MASEEPLTPVELAINGVKVREQSSWITNVTRNGDTLEDQRWGSHLLTLWGNKGISLHSNGGESIFDIRGSIVLRAYTHSKEFCWQRINRRDLALMFPSYSSEWTNTNLTSFFFFSCNLMNQMIFALSPLLVLGYILATAFESDEQESRKRNKKSDFNMEGHSE